MIVAIVAGGAAGLLTVLATRRLGRREPLFWAAALFVMQAIYVVFVLTSGDASGLVGEGLMLALFAGLAVAGARVSSWFLALGLFAHGAWDLRHLLAREDYVVSPYAELCVGFDWLLFFYLLAAIPSWERDRRAFAAEEAA